MRIGKNYFFRGCYSKGVAHECVRLLVETQRQRSEKALWWTRGRLQLCPDWNKSSVLNLGNECKGVNLTNFSTLFIPHKSIFIASFHHQKPKLSNLDHYAHTFRPRMKDWFETPILNLDSPWSIPWGDYSLSEKWVPGPPTQAQPKSWASPLL